MFAALEKVRSKYHAQHN